MTFGSLNLREDLMRRPPPARPYQPSSTNLKVPAAAVEQTVKALQAFGSIEACCLWYGRDLDQGCGVVEAVIIPRQRGTWGNYEVAPDALAQVSAATRPKGWVCLAQTHSHPASFVEHSRYDDQRAISRGVLSLVFPGYGNWKGPFPKGVGIHEYQSDYWHKLTDNQARNRISLEPALPSLHLDLR